MVVEDRPILSAEYRLPLSAKTDPPCSADSLRWVSYLLLRVAETYNVDIFCNAVWL